jgi:hypothetical protein
MASSQTARSAGDGMHSRGAFVRRAALGAAAFAGAGALATPAGATRPKHRWPSRGDDFDFIVTQEKLDVTFLTEVVKRAPGTPSERFLPVLQAANTTEFDHVTALEKIGAQALTTRFWIPDAAFGGGGVPLFAQLEVVETIELSMYLVGLDDSVRPSRAFAARVCAEALATESEHRVLARDAQLQLGADVGVPNDISFAPFAYRDMGAVRQALEALGIGYGRPGAAPGTFYDYPGDPIANGTGIPTDVRTPS